MDVWVCRQNIEHFRQQLAITGDEPQRVTLLKLLAAEEAKLKLIEHQLSTRYLSLWPTSLT